MKHTCRNPFEIVEGNDGQGWVIIILPCGRIVKMPIRAFESICQLWSEGFRLKYNGVVRIYSISPDSNRTDAICSLGAALLVIKELAAIERGVKPSLPPAWVAECGEQGPLCLDPKNFTARPAVDGVRPDWRAAWIVGLRWKALKDGENPYERLLRLRRKSQRQMKKKRRKKK